MKLSPALSFMHFRRAQWLPGTLLLAFGFFGTPAAATMIGTAMGAAQPGLYQVFPNAPAQFLTSVSSQISSGAIGYLNGEMYVANYRPGGTGDWYFGRVDVSSGAIAAVAPQNSGNWYGFAPNPAEGILYVHDLESQSLLKVSSTGERQLIGALPVDLRGLAYDPLSGTLFGTTYYSGSPALYTINTSTAAVSFVGSLGLPNAIGGGDVPLAFDSTTGVLYAADSVSRSLWAVSPQTGRATFLQGIGVPLSGLAVVSDETNTAVALAFALAVLGAARFARDSL